MSDPSDDLTVDQRIRGRMAERGLVELVDDRARLTAEAVDALRDPRMGYPLPPRVVALDACAVIPAPAHRFGRILDVCVLDIWRETEGRLHELEDELALHQRLLAAFAEDRQAAEDELG